MSKVSIAIPTYNRPDFLEQTIRSIVAQTFQDFEIFVFDDLSPYSISDFLAKLGNDPRIHFVRSETKLDGNAPNFRRIFKHTFSSPYLVIFHDDDCMHPHMLEREVKYLDEHPHAVWVGTNLTFVKDFSRMDVFPSMPALPPQTLESPAEVVRLFLEDFDLCFGSVMYRSETLVDIAPFQEKFNKWADRPLLIAHAKLGPVGVLREPLVNYRIHASQDSRNNRQPSGYREYAVTLFSFYRENLSSPLTAEDRALLLRYTSNNLLQFAYTISTTFKDYISNIQFFSAHGLVKWRFLNVRGLVYFLRSTFKLFA